MVAIPGLNGHREETWTAKNGKLWLRDEAFLPKDLPTARIMLWGYDARTHAKEEIDAQSLFQHAQELISGLTRARVESQVSLSSMVEMSDSKALHRP